MIKSLVSCVIKWINEFPTKGVTPKTMIPSMIVKGKPNNYSNQENIVFRSYALVDTCTSNTMNIRIIQSKELNKSNDHGGHKFVNL